MYGSVYAYVYVYVCVCVRVEYGAANVRKIRRSMEYMAKCMCVCVCGCVRAVCVE